MENKDLKNQQVDDSELDEVSGGKKLWDVFTTEFTEFFDKPKRRRGLLEEEDEELWGASTLEMRVNPGQRQDDRDSRKTMKL